VTGPVTQALTNVNSGQLS